MKLEGLSLREKVGQIFMVGFAGEEPTPGVRRLITEYGLGGVIYFSRNISSAVQVATLTNDLQELARIPLIVSTDQEGGIVARLDEEAGFAVPPSARAYGVLDDMGAARRAAQLTAAQLRAVGVTMNFAPVLDVNNNRDNPVIGVRSFGPAPELVARMGAAQVAGYQDGLPARGILATGKHFPGHGDTDVDSHLDLPRIDRSLTELEQVELLPFRRAVAAGCAAIMTAHILFTAVDSQLPATLSRPVLDGLLRRRLGFDGLVVTDCMEMAAVAGRFGPAEAVVMALEAGVDMVLYSHTLEMQLEAMEGVYDAVRAGRLPEDRLDEAITRVFRAKRMLGLDRAGGRVDPQTASSRTGTREQRRQVAGHARRALRVVDEQVEPGRWGPDTRVEYAPVLGSARKPVESPRAWERRLRRLLEGRVQVVELGTADADRDVPGSRSIAAGSATSPRPDVRLVVSLNAWRHPAQQEALRRLLRADCPIVHLALRGERDLEYSEGLASRLCVYDDLDVSFSAVIDYLAGDPGAGRQSRDGPTGGTDS